MGTWLQQNVPMVNLLVAAAADVCRGRGVWESVYKDNYNNESLERAYTRRIITNSHEIGLVYIRIK